MTRSKTVGSTKLPCCQSSPRDTLAATGDKLRAVVLRDLAVGKDAVALSRGDDRTHLRIVLKWVADADLAGLGDEIREEAVVDVLDGGRVGCGRCSADRRW